jgi:hypothetical protein
LTEQEQDEIGALSSRAQVSPFHAVFTYNYTEFRGDPHRLLTTCFDAWLRVDSTSRVLSLRLPRAGFEPARADPYRVESDSYSDEGVLCEPAGEAVLLTVGLEELFVGWVEGEGQLEPLLPLREELLSGDDRALYLFWLATFRHGLVGDVLDDDDDDEDGIDEDGIDEDGIDEDDDEDGIDEDDDEDGIDEDGIDGDDEHRDLGVFVTGEQLEPPVPPGLGELEAHHRAFAELFFIPEGLLAAAAEASAPLPARDEGEGLEDEVIRSLDDEEREKLLLRVARGEHLEAYRELRRRVRALESARRGAAAGAASGGNRRSLTTLSLAARRQSRKLRSSAREARLDEIERDREALWKQARAKLGASHPRYAEPVRILARLHSLAAARGDLAAFQRRLRRLPRFGESAAFMSRLRDAGVVTD